METHKKAYHPIDIDEQYTRRALEADLLKVTAAIVAELLIFFIWFDGPARERYEILVHIALPICIVFPTLNYRYLIVVPFIAFLPDVARAFGIGVSHSLVVLPLIFLVAVVPFLRRPKTAFIAGYAACAIWASHLIIDARKYTTVQLVGGYPWSVLVLYALLLTVLGFLLLWLLQLRETHEDNEEP
ncbi:MAG: hypothetical protein ACXV5H_04200 [Halobacteriota archaeon]